MRAHDTFFFSAIFFILGVFFSSLGLKTSIIFISLLVIGFLFLASATQNIKKIFLIATLAPIIIIGSLFYSSHSLALKYETDLIFNQKIKISGRVLSNPKTTKVQQFKFQTENQKNGFILVFASPSPEISYSDILEITGTLKQPDRNSYRAENIIALMSFPEKLIVKKYNELSLKNHLFSLRKKIINIFQKTLPYEEAGLLSGLTLGSKENFSEEFKNALSKSGTAHVVALSGYNIMLILNYTVSFLTNFFKKTKAVIVSFLIITGFVVMTGGEASIIRAAIMSAVASVAPLVGRVHKPRNIIVLTVLIMALQNPNIVAYDIGFQLSFLSLLGIIYLKPLIQKIIKIENNFMDWRENLTTTVSAQVLVTPLIIFYFSVFSWTAVFANTLILPLIPTTTGLGFITAVLGLINERFAILPAWLSFIFLKTEITIIKLFG